MQGIFLALNASVLTVIRLGDPFTGAFMVHGDSYLYLSRHNIYYFRAIVPDGIGEDLHKLEYRRSMRTRSLLSARYMGRVLRVSFESHLAGVSTGMITWDELKGILDKQLLQLIAAERENLKKTGPYPLMADDIWKFNTIPNYQKAIHDISTARAESMSGASQTQLPEFVENLAVSILKEGHVNLDRSSDLFKQFCEATVRMYLEFTQQRIALNDEARSFQGERQVSSVLHQTSSFPCVAKGRLISEVVDTYCEEMVAGGNWIPKTESEYRSAYKLLIGIITDMPIELVDYPTAQHFKTAMLKLPANMNKKPLYREKTIQEILTMQIPKADLLSVSKVNSYIGRVSALFNWAVKNGHVQKNPFSGMKVKEKIAGHEKRYPFTNSDLKAIFSSADYQMGKHKHPHYFWLPLLGLYTGARIEELCQLHLKDIRQDGSLWVIDINDHEEKKLKTASSARVIPLHSRLIELGLIEYVTRVGKKKGQERLFPELKKRRDGYSQDASKWFARYRKRCGVTGERKTFHSFRHTVADYLKQKGFTKEMIAAIVGHKDESITTGWYGKPYEPAALVQVIESLQFPVEVPSFWAKF